MPSYHGSIFQSPQQNPVSAVEIPVHSLDITAMNHFVPTKFVENFIYPTDRFRRVRFADIEDGLAVFQHLMFHKGLGR
jgi:hypothetical protein